MPNQLASTTLRPRQARRHWIPASVTVCAAAAIVVTGAAAATAAASTDVGFGAGAQVRSRAVLSTASTSLGTIVVDSTGRTVYEFAADSKGHSTCAGGCLTYWPLVTAPSAMPASVPGISGKVGFIKRSDGKRQLTLNGMPLYRFTGDSKAGQTNGQGSTGSGAKWWVVSSSGKQITTHTSAGSAVDSSTTPPAGGGGDIYNY
ncbi:MAG: hypothetical protein Q7L55_08660 [Actinomycetota bacterium]|nr:hypothetical protein [Actinomycetota bacterium]